MRGTITEQFAAIFAYRNRKDHEPEPVVSSFVTEPSNDNRIVAKSERLSGERLLRVTPSIEEIFRAMRGDWVENDAQQVVAIGPLRFSDGKQTERAYRVREGKVEAFASRMPVGAMLGCTETLTEDAGGQSAGITIGNATFSERLGVTHRKYIPSGVRRRGRSFSQAQSRKILDDAIANTSVLPPVTKCPPGVASGTAQYSDQFIGMKIGSTGKGGAPAWVDVYSAKVEQEIERRAHDALSMKDKDVLAAAMTASSLAELGSHGHRRTMERQGRRNLIAANDNYMAAIKKLSA